jgi:hypothetical protein
MQLSTSTSSLRQLDLCLLRWSITLESSWSKLCPFNKIPLIKFLYRTLHKIYTYIQAQQDGNKIKNLFRNTEIQNLLKDCQSGLDQAMEVFRVCTTSFSGSRTECS